MADHILKLEGNAIPRDGDVEVEVLTGLKKGTRYSVRPKNHASCHGTGRIVRIVQRGKHTEGVPDICDCIRRPVLREVGPKEDLEARWLTAEQRAKFRTERLAAELAHAKQDLAELLEKRDTAVEQCRAGAAEARGKVDVLAQDEQVLREALALQKDESAAADVALTQAREAFEAAKLSAGHARLVVKDYERRLEGIAKLRAGAQSTATALEREAARISERQDYVAAIGSARREVERLEQEQREVEAAKLTPTATPSDAAAPESEAA